MTHYKVSHGVPKIIHKIWFDFSNDGSGKEIPQKYLDLEQKCSALNQEWKIIHWTEEMANNFMRENFPFFYQKFINYKYPIQKVDAIRYFLLYYYGGVYMDIDTISIEPYEDLLQYDCVMGKQCGEREGLCNAIMFSKPKSEFFRKWIEVYPDHFDPKGWDEASVILPLQLARLYPNTIHVLPESTFFKPSWKEVDKIFESLVRLSTD